MSPTLPPTPVCGLQVRANVGTYQLTGSADHPKLKREQHRVIGQAGCRWTLAAVVTEVRRVLHEQVAAAMGADEAERVTGLNVARGVIAAS